MPRNLRKRKNVTQERKEAMEKRLVHTDELKHWIAKSGKSKDLLAERMGITRMALHNKISGKTDFTCYEAAVLKHELHLNELAIFCRVFGFMGD